MNIRAEKKEDYPWIARIHELAFRRKNEGWLVASLRGTQSFIPKLSLVAEEENQYFGHILFCTVWIINATQSFPTLSLGPMAVLPPYQRRGIGSMLIQEGLKQAAKMDFNSVIVLGYPDFYRKFGFEKASRWKIRLPFEAPEEAFLALELKKDALTGVSGTVQYPDAFKQV
jgi:putative acetyltransferase